MDGALAFLVNLLRHKATSIVENGGGILRNISSYIAVSQEGEKFRWVAAFGEFQLWSFFVVLDCHEPELDGFGQHSQATVHFPLTCAVHLPPLKKIRKCWELNPGLLSEKQVCYFCVMHNTNCWIPISKIKASAVKGGGGLHNTKVAIVPLNQQPRI